MTYSIGLYVAYKSGRKIDKIFVSDWYRNSGLYRNSREVSIDVALELRVTRHPYSFHGAEPAAQDGSWRWRDGLAV